MGWRSPATGLRVCRWPNRLEPDLIVLDVMMPEMDSLEYLRVIRGNPRLAEIPVILVTALDDRSSRLAGLEAGADDYVDYKPFDRTEFLAHADSHHHPLEPLSQARASS